MTTSSIMKKFSMAAAGAALIASSTAGTVQAAIINGSFETNDFTGWSTIGETNVVTSTIGSNPTEGDFQSLLVTASVNSMVDQIFIEMFLGIPIGSLDTLGNGDATEGSAIKQTFTAQAGQVLTFDWNFLTDELDFDNNPLTFNDFAFISLMGPTVSELQKLADTSFSLRPFATQFRYETGFQTFSIVLPTTGTYTLGIGVSDVGNRAFESGLLIDNVKVASVPESNSVFGLFALGAFAASSQLSAAARRRQKS